MEKNNLEMCISCPIAHIFISEYRKIKNYTKEGKKTISKNNNKVLSSGRFSIQIGAFSQESGAIKTKNEYQKKFNSNQIDTKKVLSNGKTLFKVFINGFDTYEKAQSFKNANGLGNSLISGN